MKHFDMAATLRATAIGRLAAILALAALPGCVGDGRKPVRPVARAAPSAPLPDSKAFRQCTADLASAGVRFEALPNQQRGGGCQIIDAVRLLDIGTPTANLGAMTCELAARFAAWTRYAVRPAGRLHLGSEVVRIETFGTYACRDMRGAGGTISGKLSEHAHANAIDVSAFVLADGRRISVEKDWREDGPAARFLHAIHESACKRFRTVLSPDYNAAHRDHFHFDLGGKGAYCR
jgi:hypothetical protein